MVHPGTDQGVRTRLTWAITTFNVCVVALALSIPSLSLRISHKTHRHTDTNTTAAAAQPTTVALSRGSNRHPYSSKTTHRHTDANPTGVVQKTVASLVGQVQYTEARINGSPPSPSTVCTRKRADAHRSTQPAGQHNSPFFFLSAERAASSKSFWPPVG